MKYFKLSEFACKCGCGFNDMNSLLLSFADEMREDCGFPWIIKSGCRCKSHNEKEGGKKNSDHLTGDGLDVKAKNNYQRYKIILTAISHGIDRIGIGKTFVHLGIRLQNPKERLWLYT